MSRIVRARDGIATKAFAPFGCFIERPDVPGRRRHYGEWLGGALPGLLPQMHVNAVVRSPLPLAVTRVERHPHAAQVFLPLRVSRYLVTVIPSDPSGAPCFDAVQSYVVPGHVGVIYRPGVWHVGASVLDHDANFTVLMWRGDDADDEFLDIPPFTIVAEATSTPLARTGQS